MKDNKIVFLTRILQVVLLVILSLSVVILATACSCGDNHDYTSEVTREASCSTVGEVTYTCSKCGDSYTEEISTTEHSLEYRYDANEHWQGCENCNFTTSKTVHQYDTVVQSIPSNCNTTGMETRSCACGAVKNENLPLAPHTFTVMQKDGYSHWFKCSACDATTEVKSHIFNTEISREPSTCLKEGNVVTSCECGHTHTEYLSKADHIYELTEFDNDFHWMACVTCRQDNPSQDKVPHNKSASLTDPDCTHLGKEVTTCSACDYTDIKILPMLGHDLDKTKFSKSADRSNHYYECKRCGADIAESHDLVDVVCADGLDREATCYKTGHKDQECNLCGFTLHLTVSKTDDHKFAEEWVKNGTHHWHNCLNGDGQCDARNNEEMHSWADRSIPATCETNGSIWRECEFCGYVQDGSRKTLTKLGHDYKTAEVIIEATCTQEGQSLQVCSRCQAESTVTVNKLPHDLSLYGYDEEKHWNRCANCDFEQTYKAAHTVDVGLDVVVSEGNCEEDRIVKHTCLYCKYTFTEITKTSGHNYITEDPSYTDPEKFKDSTCTELGWHMEICTVCKTSVKVFDKDFLPHDLVYHKAKEPTQNELGNIAYHVCTVCGLYFSTKNADHQLNPEDIFIYAPKIIDVDSFDDLYQYALKVEDGEISYDYYQITAKIVRVSNKALEINDVNAVEGGQTYQINIPDNIYYDFKSGDIIKIKFKMEVVYIDDELLYDFVDVDVVTVLGNDNKYDLFIESNLSMGDGSIVVSYNGEEYAFVENLKYFGVTELGGEICISYQRWTNKQGKLIELFKVLVNGNAVTASNGELIIEVQGDLHIQLIFSDSNSASVSLDSLDTSNRNEVIAVDEYVSYEYVGNYNNDGHILANSHLKFYVNNANVVGIILTYDNFNLDGEVNVFKNSLFVGADEDHKELMLQTLGENNKVILYFDAEERFKYIDYFTDSCQARLLEITILYATDNTFAN